MAGKGGKRPGSGLPKGYQFPATINKLEARELVRKMITSRMQPMIDAQLANATGLKYLVSRDKATGKFTRVTQAAFDATAPDTIEVWEKDPSVQAFSDLLDRALDQPAKHVELTGAEGGPIVIKWES